MSSGQGSHLSLASATGITLHPSTNSTHFCTSWHLRFLVCWDGYDETSVRNVSSYSVTCLPSLKSLHSVKRCIIDAVASVSATSESHALSALSPCFNLTAYPAFGPPITPKQRGTYDPL
jgi:hypothetical protein